MALPEFLSKPIAGLPTWAWGLVIIGGVAAGIYFTRSTRAAPAAPDTSALPTSTDSGTQPTPPQPAPCSPSWAQPPVNGKCPPGMHKSKDGLCRCNAPGMVNWGTVCLPPGVQPPGCGGTGTAGGGPAVSVSGDTLESAAARSGVTPTALWAVHKFDICAHNRRLGIPCSIRRNVPPAGVQLPPGLVLG